MSWMLFWLSLSVFIDWLWHISRSYIELSNLSKSFIQSTIQGKSYRYYHSHCDSQSGLDKHEFINTHTSKKKYARSWLWDLFIGIIVCFIYKYSSAINQVYNCSCSSDIDNHRLSRQLDSFHLFWLLNSRFSYFKWLVYCLCQYWTSCQCP